MRAFKALLVGKTPKRPREDDVRLQALFNQDVLEGFLAYRQRRTQHYVRPRSYL